jgi:BRCA1-associated protein
MPSSCTTFSLQVTLGYGCDSSVEETLNKACQIGPAPPSTASTSLVGSFASSLFGSSKSGEATSSSSSSSSHDRFFVASASHVEMSVDERNTYPSSTAPILVAVLIPPSLIDELLEKYTSTTKIHASGSCFWIKHSSATKLSKDLLPSIHASLLKSQIRGIVRTSIAAEDNAPAEFLLLELPPNKDLILEDVLQATNGQALNADATAVLKVLPLSRIHFELPTAAAAAAAPATIGLTSAWLKSPPPLAPQGSSHHRLSSIPTCAVCLHRIDPLRLGLPPPANAHLCSKFCPPPNLISWASELEQSCPKQRLLQPWSKGARCRACRVIQQYWDHHINHGVGLGNDLGNDEDEAAASLFCHECSMHKTLWVCLTCGYVGCGRYSNRHSVQHFQETQHPYSLELATLRIWDYVHEDRFAHRIDLLECPSSPPLTQPWMSRSLSTTTYGNSSSNHRASYHQHSAAASMTSHSSPSPMTASGMYASHEKSPKKATMIGEEYEALLQSALEDQALHYGGEISRLRAELTASLVDHTTLSPKEQAEMEEVQADISGLRSEIDSASRDLLAAQAQEAGHRATSQRLLHEQQEANTLIQNIEREARQEAQQGKLQVEDLEQQIRDLTANLKMRHQFSQSEELNEAQIFGTTETPISNKNSGKRGKKKGRFFRK